MGYTKRVNQRVYDFSIHCFKLLCFSIVSILFIPKSYSVTVNMDNWEEYVILSGTMETSYLSFTRRGSMQVRMTALDCDNQVGDCGLVFYNQVEHYPRCSSDLYDDFMAGNLDYNNLTPSQLESFYRVMNEWLSTKPKILQSYNNMLPNPKDFRIMDFDLTCIDPRPVPQLQLTAVMEGNSVEIVNPPSGGASVCSLNSQNLNLNFSSTSLNVDGLRRSTNLNVTCTTGDANDYQLKLTGSNVVAGRLNFRNGVSAQVSLNGIAVQANGSGIQLNSLISRTIPVSATLTGTAETSGVSNTTGILVLEAL